MPDFVFHLFNAMKVIQHLEVLRLPLRIVIVSLLTLFVLRVVFAIHHWEYVQPVGLKGIWQAFVLGVRFDLSVIVLGMAPMLICMSIPARWAQHSSVLRVMASLCSVSLLLALGIGVADMAYFGEVQRHLGAELFRLGADGGAVLEIAMTSRLATTAFGLFLMVAVCVAWWRFVWRAIATPVLTGSFMQRTVFLVLAFFMWVILGRGLVLNSKPLAVLDAFTLGEERVAQLALNAAFVSLKTRPDTVGDGVNFMPPQVWQAFAHDHQLLGRHPFVSLQSEPNLPVRPRHVVVLLMESWSYRYIDGLAGTRYGATPFIDSLVPKSQVWDRFYAAGQRSILGIQAVLTSTPVLNQMPTLGDGLELSRMSRMAEVAKSNGYETVNRFLLVFRHDIWMHWQVQLMICELAKLAFYVCEVS
jgi:phosphoglycerol transferase MdoB-like AlkP superfamily enzyme